MDLLMLLWITMCLDFVVSLKINENHSLCSRFRFQVKFGSMLCKCFILLLPESVTAYKQRVRERSSIVLFGYYEIDFRVVIIAG